MEVARDKQSEYKLLRWLLIPAIAAHNFEEWLTFPTFRNDSGALMERFGLVLETPSWDVTQLALLMVTLLPAILIALASTGRQGAMKHFIVCAVAGVFFANIFVPHIPAAFVARGYSPGIVTAVAINLPLCLYLWKSAVAEDVLSVRQVIASAALGAILLVPSIVGIMLLSDLLLKS